MKFNSLLISLSLLFITGCERINISRNIENGNTELTISGQSEGIIARRYNEKLYIKGNGEFIDQGNIKLVMNRKVYSGDLGNLIGFIHFLKSDRDENMIDIELIYKYNDGDYSAFYGNGIRKYEIDLTSR